MTTTQIMDEVSSMVKLPENLNSKKTIILGVGNISRGDDGLGWAFLKELESWDDFKAEMEYRYLLLVEDASLIANYDNVIFVDAYHGELENGFTFERQLPGDEFEFSTHIIPPASILYLTEELYEKRPNAFTLAISGKQWELGKAMGEDAEGNLKKAIDSFKKHLQ